MMNRRGFLGSSLGGLLALGGAPTALGASGMGGAGGPAAPAPASIAGQTPAQLRDLFRRDLFEHYLPFQDRFVNDRKYGGFMCNINPAGEHISTGKYIWYEGRGTWVYSYLFNHFGQRPEWLEVARRSIEFLMPHKPEGEGRLWPERYTREGEPTAESSGRIYGDTFVAEGMAEFSRASGEARWVDLARETLFKCVRLYDRPDYVPGSQMAGDEAHITGARVLGHWMVLVRLTTQMLRQRPDDAELRALSDRSLEAIIEHHHNPRFELLNEVISHDMSRHEFYAQFSYLGHAIETLWMAMDEAQRRGDGDLFQMLAGRFKRHVEVAKDRVYGGLLRSAEHVDEHRYTLDKTFWVQQEALIGAMMLYEATRDPWALELWNELYPWVRRSYLIKGGPFEVWQVVADRRGEHSGNFGRMENYHFPRFLMLNLQVLERLAAA